MDSAKRDDRRGHRAGRLAIGLLVALLAVTGLSLRLFGQSGDGPELAPQFTLRNLDGEEVALAEYLGSVVIFDFWASWCHVCRETFPEIHALAKAYEERGVALLILCFDKSAEEARAYLVDNGFATGNVLWGSLEEAHAVRELYGIEAVVHTFLIDRTGYIRFSGHPIRLTAEELERWL